MDRLIYTAMTGAKHILEQQATDIAFNEVILDFRGGSALFQGEKARAYRASLLLTNRALEAGVIRPDFDHSDLYLLQNAAAGLMRGARKSAPDAWRRLGDYMLQAFRVQGDEELAPPPKVWLRTRALHRGE